MIVGVDFGAPKLARAQRRKIIAVAARLTGPRSYRIDSNGINGRLLSTGPPGWSARELVDELVARPARVVGFDFPFSIPQFLLHDPKFASDSGHPGPFLGWRPFNDWISQCLPIRDPLDFSPFALWQARAERSRLWTKRATDVATGGHPPLKDKFQVMFQMTLLGNAVLSALRGSNKYHVVPFSEERGDGEVIEIYPGGTLKKLGLVNYKSQPAEAINLSIAACGAAGIKLEVDPGIVALACRYTSGTGKSPDYDVADALVALCTSILYAEGCCYPELGPSAAFPEDGIEKWEGVIWLPKVGELA